MLLRIEMGGILLQKVGPRLSTPCLPSKTISDADWKPTADVPEGSQKDKYACDASEELTPIPDF